MVLWVECIGYRCCYTAYMGPLFVCSFGVPLVDGGRGWVPCGLTPCSFSACYRSAGRVSADCNIASVMLVRCLLMIGQY